MVDIAETEVTLDLSPLEVPREYAVDDGEEEEGHQDDQPAEWPGTLPHTVTRSTLDLQDRIYIVHTFQGLVQFQLSTFFFRLVVYWDYYTQLPSQLLEF